MTARVAIDLALDRLFDYEVPEALEGKLAVGQLLSVPFGHREARGFVMEVEEDEMPETRGEASRLASCVSRPLKPITAIVDETPFFSPALLSLIKRVAAYTAAPIESVLRAALPAVVVKRNAKAKELLFVEPAGFVADTRSSRLARDSRSSSASSLSSSSSASSSSSVSSQALTERQAWLVENIARLGGGWMAQICRELKTTPATIRHLAGLGVVKVSMREQRRNPLAGSHILPSKPLALNSEQSAALETVSSASAKPVLLMGVTGSGKTEVYLQAISRELDSGRGAIVLVPEISLTPQTARRFASRFGGAVAVLHSALSDGERYDEWHRIRSGEARVVVGSRSAVWAPVANLGLIVVDEEHDRSYKQDDSPRYHARDVAVLRGAMEGAKVVLGSATPSLESWMNVRKGKYELATMSRRAGKGTLPAVHLVASCGAGIFSRELMEAISLRLDRGEQTMLFLNRRGYSRSVVCEACGCAIECPGCGLPYTYHRADSCLRCHVCGEWRELPRVCPQCGAAALDYRGIGTQRAEAALKKCFPRATVLRMDADSTSRRHSHEDILSAFRRGEADILIGTQMIVKGLDFPNVTLVGALNADSSLNMPDFRAAERTFQLLAQVSGRAGRAELPGEVFIQCRDTTLPVFSHAAHGDFVRFAKEELEERERCYMPPFCRLSAIGMSSTDQNLVAGWAEMYSESLRRYAKLQSGAGMLVSEAMPAAIETVAGRYRWQIVMRALSNAAIVKAWRWISETRPPPGKLRVALDIDAFDLV